MTRSDVCMTHSLVWRDSSMCYIRAGMWTHDMTHSLCDLTHPFTPLTWLIHSCAWLIHSFGMTHLCATYAQICECMPWLIHLCDMPHSLLWHDSSINSCDLTHPSATYVDECHDPSTHVTWLVQVPHTCLQRMPSVRLRIQPGFSGYFCQPHPPPSRRRRLFVMVGVVGEGFAVLFSTLSDLRYDGKIPSMLWNDCIKFHEDPL